MKTLFLFAITACLIFSCGHKHPKSNDTICSSSNTAYFPSDAKARFFFKSGTWWLYKSNASLTDSIYISQGQMEIAPPPSKVFGEIKDKCYESGTMLKIANYVGNSSSQYAYQQPKSDMNYSKELFQIIEIIGMGTSLYRFEMHGNNYVTAQDGGIVTFEDSIVTSYDTLKNVLHLSYPTAIHNDYIQDGWYVQNIGLVKYIHKDGTIWELYKYHIKQ